MMPGPASSVMPHSSRIGVPTRSSHSVAFAAGMACPPTTAVRNDDRSYFPKSGYDSM